MDKKTVLDPDPLSWIIYSRNQLNNPWHACEVGDWCVYSWIGEFRNL